MTETGRCPLCATEGGVEEATVSYEEIRAGLLTQWGVRFRDKTWWANAPEATTRSIRCLACGLEWFEPLAPGDADFYGELMAVLPYNGWRWEFDVVQQCLLPAADVVDVGCGEGAFIRGLGGRPGRTVGLDHHLAAVDRLSADGLEAHAVDLRSFADEQQGRFDVVTAFHLLEHVADPVGVIGSARRCLRSSGRVFVSVPNRDRVSRSPDEWLDRPPHHLTRWSAEQLTSLASRAGMELGALRYEPPDLSVLRVRAQAGSERSLAWMPAAPRGFLDKAWGRLAVGPRRYRAAVRDDAYPRRALYGHSMLAELVLAD